MRFAVGLVIVGAIIALLLVVERSVDRTSGRSSDAIARAWNEHRAAAACTATNATAIEAGLLDAQPGDHIVCDDAVGSRDYQDKPPIIPQGYHVVFFTASCSTCAVGWVLVKGTSCGPDDLNCED